MTESCHPGYPFIDGGHLHQCTTCGEWYDTPCDCPDRAPSAKGLPYHLLHATLVNGGIIWRSTCPEEDTDYRCRKCSVGDLGCVLESLLDDGIDAMELFNGRIENPQFPLKVKVFHSYQNDDDCTLELWEGRS